MKVTDVQQQTFYIQLKKINLLKSPTPLFVPGRKTE